MRMCVYEDDGVERLEPLTLTRPACDLWCGAMPLLERQRQHFAADEVALLVRPWLAEWCRFLHPDRPVNDPDWLGRGGPLLLVNARWLPPAERLVGGHGVAFVGDQVAYAAVPSARLRDSCPEGLAGALAEWQHTLPHVWAGGHLIDYPWDLVRRNAQTLARDFKRLPGRAEAAPGLARWALIGPAERLFLHAGACVEPLAALDTTHGPVIVDRGALVQAFSRLEGPCYVGPGTRVLRARVAGSTLGPGCRVGGEVQDSILQGHANKQHDGFLGHSYVGEWVNLAAGTQVADLRNDYASVGVTAAGERVDTGLLKVGAFLGDHTRTGLGTLLDCGTVAGAFAHLLSSGELLPRLIPSFCACRSGRLEGRTDLRRLFAAAATALRRRGRTWTEAHAELFLALYEQTAAGRRQALAGAEPGRGWSLAC